MKTTVAISRSLHKKVKAAAALAGCGIGDYIAAAVEDAVEADFFFHAKKKASAKAARRTKKRDRDFTSFMQRLLGEETNK